MIRRPPRFTLFPYTPLFRSRLRDRPRKAVEDEPADPVGALQPLAPDPDHHVVADQLAAIHDRLGPLADAGLRVHRLAQDVPRRNLGDPPSSGEPFSLRTFSRARRPEHEQVQRHMVVGPSSLVFGRWSPT